MTVQEVSEKQEPDDDQQTLSAVTSSSTFTTEKKPGEKLTWIPIDKTGISLRGNRSLALECYETGQHSTLEDHNYSLDSSGQSEEQKGLILRLCQRWDATVCWFLFEHIPYTPLRRTTQVICLPLLLIRALVFNTLASIFDDWRTRGWRRDASAYEKWKTPKDVQDTDENGLRYLWKSGVSSKGHRSMAMLKVETGEETTVADEVYLQDFDNIEMRPFFQAMDEAVCQMVDVCNSLEKRKPGFLRNALELAWESVFVLKVGLVCCWFLCKSSVQQRWKRFRYGVQEQPEKA